MSPRSYSTPASSAPVGSIAAVADKLWQKALETAGPVPIYDDCRGQLHHIIQRGAERMFAENRTTARDIVLAEENVARLVDLMKHHAVLFNHPQWLGEDTLGASDNALRVMRFELWPFWPW